MKVTCYRLEHPSDKKGIFTSESAFEMPDSIFYSHSDMPTPLWDFFDGDFSLFDHYVAKGYICAYPSKNVLKAFIGDTYNLMKDNGFKLYKIEAETCFVSSCQVFLNPEEITTKKEIDYDKVFKEDGRTSRTEVYNF